jgi:hypothetical protein
MAIFPWLRTPAHPERSHFLARKSEDPMNSILKFVSTLCEIEAQPIGLRRRTFHPMTAALGRWQNTARRADPERASAIIRHV